jgi:hypothetical protein
VQGIGPLLSLSSGPTPIVFRDQPYSIAALYAADHETRESLSSVPADSNRGGFRTGLVLTRSTASLDTSSLIRFTRANGNDNLGVIDAETGNDVSIRCSWWIDITYLALVVCIKSARSHGNHVRIGSSAQLSQNLNLVFSGGFASLQQFSLANYNQTSEVDYSYTLVPSSCSTSTRHHRSGTRTI